MITAGQLVAHAVGDYVIQSDWMAQQKTSKHLPALVHALTYTLCFLAVTRSLGALYIIFVTHFIIDRWRLARYVCWAKNWLAPWQRQNKSYAEGDPRIITDPLPKWIPPTKPWKECIVTGYDPDRPPWLSVWLLIIADNTMHVLCNGVAVYLGGSR